MKEQEMIQRLNNAGYELKHSEALGWWIAGRGGCPVTDILSVKKESIVSALLAAFTKIEQAQSTGKFPVWFTNKKL